MPKQEQGECPKHIANTMRLVSTNLERGLTELLLQEFGTLETGYVTKVFATGMNEGNPVLVIKSTPLPSGSQE